MITRIPKEVEFARNTPTNKRKKKRKVNTEGYLVVFDVTDKKSFIKACELTEELFDYYRYDPDSGTECPVTVFLMGNKIGNHSQLNDIILPRSRAT